MDRNASGLTVPENQRLAVLGLGANLGPAEDSLRWAIEALTSVLDELRVAPLYRSTAVSPIPQSAYLNTVVAGHARLPAVALLAVGKKLEWIAGRRPGARNGPRALDVDLLLFQGVAEKHPELTIPHPQLEKRSFVLAPLADLLPSLVLPESGRTPGMTLEALVDPSPVSRLQWRRRPRC